MRRWRGAICLIVLGLIFLSGLALVSGPDPQEDVAEDPSDLDSPSLQEAEPLSEEATPVATTTSYGFFILGEDFYTGKVLHIQAGLDPTIPREEARDILPMIVEYAREGDFEVEVKYPITKIVLENLRLRLDHCHHIPIQDFVEMVQARYLDDPAALDGFRFCPESGMMMISYPEPPGWIRTYLNISSYWQRDSEISDRVHHSSWIDPDLLPICISFN